MEPSASVRIDKWLWAVRLYKTRTLAADACVAGKVRVAEQSVKPSRLIRAGEIITAVTGEITRTVKVVGLVDKRVGAKLVPQHLEDLTPASEYEKPRDPNFTPFMFRPKGAGRPTKKDRRSIDKLQE
ncbi:MAG: RNA-binding S4 domain-containing protein [Limisphaerales bacterium]